MSDRDTQENEIRFSIIAKSNRLTNETEPKVLKSFIIKKMEDKVWEYEYTTADSRVKETFDLRKLKYPQKERKIFMYKMHAKLLRKMEAKGFVVMPDPAYMASLLKRAKRDKFTIYEIGWTVMKEGDMTVLSNKTIYSKMMEASYKMRKELGEELVTRLENRLTKDLKPWEVQAQDLSVETVSEIETYESGELLEMDEELLADIALFNKKQGLGE